MLKIIDDRQDVKNVEFKNLKPGDVFTTPNSTMLYLRIEDLETLGKSLKRAVELVGHFSVVIFLDETPVIPLDAELRFKEG